MSSGHKIDSLILPQFPDTSQHFMTDFSTKVASHCERERDVGMAAAAALSASGPASASSSVRSRLSDHSSSSGANSRIAKCIVVGDIAVGKTCVINRFGYDIFSNNYKATIGVDFDVQKFTILGLPFNLQIWDTAGQERFRCITSTYYRGAHVALIVFDLSNLTSLETVRRWRDEIYDSNPKARPLLFLVGNKKDKLTSNLANSNADSHNHSKEAESGNQRSSTADLVHREAIKVAKDLEAEYWTVSAATGENISELFYRVASVTFNELVGREAEEEERERVGMSGGGGGLMMGGWGSKPNGNGKDASNQRHGAELERYASNNFIKLASPKGKRLSKEFKDPPRSCITINCVIK